MKLIVGLGNPGLKYEVTRHNAGFLMVDEIVDHFKIEWSGEKFLASCAKGQMLGESCLLLKPVTFMNLSGRSVGAALRFLKLGPSDLIVLHDDIDVLSGEVKARLGGGHGGHNGIRSIMQEAGVSEFHRIKLGVGRPEAKVCKNVDDWVLGRFSDAELLALQEDMFTEVLVRLENILK